MAIAPEEVQLEALLNAARAAEAPLLTRVGWRTVADEQVAFCQALQAAAAGGDAIAHAWVRAGGRAWCIQLQSSPKYSLHGRVFRLDRLQTQNVH